MIRESGDQNAKWIVYYYDSKAYTWLSEMLNSLGMDQTFEVCLKYIIFQPVNFGIK